MVWHGTEPQNLDIVTGSDRTNRSKPDQIVTLAVEKEAVVGRSLIAVVQDATLKSAVLHKYVNSLLLVVAVFTGILNRRTKMGISFYFCNRSFLGREMEAADTVVFTQILLRKTRRRIFVSVSN
jgi:hypothetical protein